MSKKKKTNKGSLGRGGEWGWLRHAGLFDKPGVMSALLFFFFFLLPPCRNHLYFFGGKEGETNDGWMEWGKREPLCDTAVWHVGWVGGGKEGGGVFHFVLIYR